MEIIGFLFIGFIAFFAATSHARQHYQRQVDIYSQAVERGIKARDDEHRKIAVHVKEQMVREGLAFAFASAPKGAKQMDAESAGKPLQAQAPMSPATSGKVAIEPLQQGTGRVVFLGEVFDSAKQYDIFTCRLLGKDGEVEFRGAQLKNEGLRMGDLASIRRLPSESITRPDGSTRRHNRFEVVKIDAAPAAHDEASQEVLSDLPLPAVSAGA